MARHFPSSRYAMKPSSLCPSCRQPMQTQTLAGHDHGLGQGRGGAGPVLCLPGHLVWTTGRTLKLHPQAVVELFALLHQHRTDERRPLQHHLTLPTLRAAPCREGYDMVRSGRYMVIPLRAAARAL